jgi:hypothetical protein
VKSPIVLAMLVLGLAACAEQETKTAGKGWVEPQYRTGSNIPTHRSSAADGVETMTKEDVDRARDSSFNPGVSMPPRRPGAGG